MTDRDFRLSRSSPSRELTPDQQLWQLWRQGRRPFLTDFLAQHTNLSPAQVASIIGIDQYERWRLGERISAEDYLALLPQGDERDQAICDVIWGEYLLREQLGEQPNADDYRLRFPDQAELFTRQHEFHQAINDGAPPVSVNQRTVVAGRRLPSGRLDVPLIPGYEILDQIGQGGMGVVYKARQISLDRIVALKVVAVATGPGGATDPAMLDRKRREAKITARLSHPNIVTVYDAGPFGASFYLAMELISGVDLHRLIDERGPLPIPMACDYLRQSALGLQHAHEQGLVHRDIKPSNLMISNATSEGGFGTLKILDLGLARLLPSLHPDQTALTQDGAFMGTPDFIAPEQANDPRNADIRSDLYSLGCTFYCMLAGQPPFKASTPLAKLVQHHVKDPAPVESLRADVPPGVSAILRMLIAKAPEDRYQTPAEVVEALAALSQPEAQSRMTPVPPRPSSSGLTRTSGLCCRWTSHTDRIKGVAFSPDGRWLASASLDQTVRVWKASQQSEAWSLTTEAGVSCVAFSPNGDRIVASGEDRSLSCWEVASRSRLWRVEGENVPALAYTPAGDTILAVALNGALRLHDAATGHELRTWPAHTGAAWCLAMASDGRTVLTGGQDRSLRVWDVHKGESLAAFPEQPMLVTCVAISPDGTRALTGGVDGILHIWDMTRQREVGTLQGHEGRVTSVAFSPDGKRAVSGSRDQSVRTWDVTTGKQVDVYTGHARWVTTVAWSPTEALIASGGIDRAVCLWAGSATV